MKTMYINRFIGCAVAATVCLTSCTDVELWDEATYKEAHRTEVSVDYTGASWKSSPTDMYVLASRTTMPERIGYRQSLTSTSGETLFGDIAAADSIPSLSNGFYAWYGQYHFLTFNIADGVYTNAIDYLQEASSCDPISKIFVGYSDENVTSPFPKTYYDVIKTQEINTPNTTVSFSPQEVGQNVTLNFSIKKETNDFIVKSIEGNLSGIPTKFYLTTAYVDVENCGTIAFDSSNFASGIEADPYADSYTFSIQFNVLGLYVTEDQYENKSVTETDPGVLRLAITVVDDEGNERVINAVSGLYYSITNSGSVVLADDDEHYKALHNADITVDIKSPLVLNRNMVSDSGEAPYNADIWKNENR